MTVSSFQSPTVTEDILAPANLHKQLKENAVLILLDLVDIAELWLSARLRGKGGGMMLKSHVFTCAQNMVFYFGIFTSLMFCHSGIMGKPIYLKSKKNISAQISMAYCQK